MPRFPESKVVPHSRMDEVEIKREPLTPLSSLELPRQKPVPITSVNQGCRSMRGASSRRQELDSPEWWTVADTEKKPVMGNMRDWEDENHPCIAQPHQQSPNLKHTGYFAEDYTKKGRMASTSLETDHQSIYFPFHEKKRIRPVKSSILTATASEHRRDGFVWGANSPRDVTDTRAMISCLSPKPRKKNLPHDKEKHDLNMMDCRELYPHGMPRSSGSSSVSETFSSAERMFRWEQSPSKVARTPKSSSYTNQQWTSSSSGHDDWRPLPDPSGERENTKTPVANISAHKASVDRMQHLSMSVPDSRPRYALTTPQALSRGQQRLTSACYVKEPSLQTPPERKRRFSTDTATSDIRKYLYPSSACEDSRNAESARFSLGENSLSAKLGYHASADKGTRKDKTQKKITAYAGTVKKRKIAKTAETRNSIREEEDEGEDDEDPLSVLNKRHHKTSGVYKTHDIPSSEDGERCTDRAENLPQSVLDVSAMKDRQRQQLSATLLQESTLISCLVLYEDGTTNTDSSLFKRPKVEGVLLHCKEKSYLLPVPQRSDAGTTQWSRNALRGLLKKEDTVKVAINSKQFVIALLRDFSLGDNRGAVAWLFEDPLIAGWLLSPDNPPHTLRALCKSVHLTGSAQDGGPDGELKTSMVVMDRLRVRLAKEHLWPLFLHVEMALTPLIAAMELQAIRVHVHAFLTSSKILKKKMEKVERKAYELAGHPFLINSTLQLRQLLYEELRLDQQLPGSRKVTLTASANHKSTSEAMLKQMVTFHPLPAVILEYRHLCKLKSTYVDGMLEAVEEGVLHTHWDQTSAATGRLVSSHPNLQAIPKTPTTITDLQHDFIVGSEKESCEIYAREPFVANDGNVFLAADFQQIELRLLAHLANDPALKDMFRSGGDKSADIFIQLTAQWLAKSYKDVKHAEREQTKRVVYSILYGVGKERLAEYLKVTSSRAKDIMDSFLVSFPAIQVFTKKCVDYAQKHGYTETVMGRKRWLDRVHHKAAPVRAQAERQAVNFCVQGSAADLCKKAMVNVERALHDRTHLSARMLMHIHDELVWELPRDQLPEMCELVKRVMEDDASLCRPLLPGLTVPITVSLSSGTSWAHLSPCGP